MAVIKEINLTMIGKYCMRLVFNTLLQDENLQEIYSNLANLLKTVKFWIYYHWKIVKAEW